MLRAVVRLSIWVDFGVVALIFSSNFCRLIADFGHFASDSRVCYCAVVGVVVWLWNGIQNCDVGADYLLPVTAACYDGLRNTPQAWLDLAKTFNISPLRLLLKVRLPAALPAFASGLRIAVSVAPIGAVVGEWVGSSEGLGYLMIHANARMQVDLMFAALLILVSISLCLYFSIDWLLHRFIWSV